MRRIICVGFETFLPETQDWRFIMLFRANEVHGVFVYDLTAVGNHCQWSEKVRDYYNKGDEIVVDFDVVIETHFTADFLRGQVSPVDQEAQDWAAPLLEMMKVEQEEMLAES
jgi:hypothetical protein